MEQLTKVTAYITCAGKLLVFKHVHYPQAGIQVPGGTTEPNEDLERAVIREAEEESGLEGLEVVSYLGDIEFTFEPPGEYAVRIQRHFFHLAWPGPIVEESWQHWELSPSAGDEEKFLFELYWVPLDALPALSGNLGNMVNELLE